MDKPSILITEDDEEMRTLLRYFLEREGFELLFATDGQEARMMIDMMSPPACILLDIMLPYMNGFELIEYIRHRPDWKEVPIMVLSARSAEADVVRALDGGADDYIVKPFKLSELTARIRRFIKSTR